MSNVTIYNGKNSQQITLAGLKDLSGGFVSAATVSGYLMRNGKVLPNGTLTFSAVAGVAGSYAATLSGFDVAAGDAQLRLVGSNAGSTFNFSIQIEIAARTL